MLENVFQELKTSKITLKNRIIMPPMATRLSNSDGTVGTEIINFYKKRAIGSNLGLIIVEHAYVDYKGKTPNMLAIDSDDKIAGLSKLVKTIHEENVPTVAQINYIGKILYNEDTSLLWPSVKEIHELTEKYKNAAVRAKKAGFDGVEIHCCHGFLLDQFYSPLTNHRKDSYGGSLENRMRFPLEVFNASREALGEDYPIFFRLGACDYIEGGNTPQDGLKAAKLLEKAGVDLIDISGGICFYNHPTKTNPGYFSDSSKPIKDNINLPVILSGGVKNLEQADDLIKNGYADIIGVGRAILKDANWMDKQLKLYE